MCDYIYFTTTTVVVYDQLMIWVQFPLDGIAMTNWQAGAQHRVTRTAGRDEPRRVGSHVRLVSFFTVERPNEDFLFSQPIFTLNDIELKERLPDDCAVSLPVIRMPEVQVIVERMLQYLELKNQASEGITNLEDLIQ